MKELEISEVTRRAKSKKGFRVHGNVSETGEITFTSTHAGSILAVHDSIHTDMIKAIKLSVEIVFTTSKFNFSALDTFKSNVKSHRKSTPTLTVESVPGSLNKTIIEMDYVGTEDGSHINNHIEDIVNMYRTMCKQVDQKPHVDANIKAIIAMTDYNSNQFKGIFVSTFTKLNNNGGPDTNNFGFVNLPEGVDHIPVEECSNGLLPIFANSEKNAKLVKNIEYKTVRFKSQCRIEEFSVQTFIEKHEGVHIPFFTDHSFSIENTNLSKPMVSVRGGCPVIGNATVNVYGNKPTTNKLTVYIRKLGRKNYKLINDNVINITANIIGKSLSDRVSAIYGS